MDLLDLRSVKNSVYSNFQAIHVSEVPLTLFKGLGSDCISRAHSVIWGKLGTALQAYTRDVRGGLLFRGAGRGGAKVKIHGAG